MLTATDPTNHRFNCLICYGSYNTASGHRLFGSSEEPFASADANRENEDAHNTDGRDSFPVSLFIFKKLLEIPEEELTNLIHLHSEDSRIKAQLCKECNTMVLQALVIYKELLELTSRFREIQKQVLRVVRESFHSSDGDPNEINYGLGDNCRKFAVLKGIARDGTDHLEGSFAVEQILPFDVITVFIKNEIEEESGSGGFGKSEGSPVWNFSSNDNPDNDDEQDCSETIPAFSSSSHIIKDGCEQDQELHFLDDDSVEAKLKTKKRKLVIKLKKPSSPIDVPLQKRKRGRPRILSNTDVASYARKVVREKDNNDDIDAKPDPPGKRGRGRPRKLKNVDLQANKDTHEVQVDNSVVDVDATSTVKTSSIDPLGKRNRGNPTKLSSNTDVASNARKEILELEEHNNENDGDAKLKSEAPSSDPPQRRKRGRPRKLKEIKKKKNKQDLDFNPFLVKYQVCQANPTTKRFHCMEEGCEKRYPRKYPLLVHVQHHHYGEKPFKCELPGCEKSFVERYSLLAHQHRHNGTPKYKCKDCPATFYARNPMVRHQEQVHLNGAINKPFICELCGRSFSCRDYLYAHRQLQHTAKAKAYQQKRVSTKSDNSHDDARVVCDICGISLKNKMILKSHLKYIHEKKPWNFICSHCPRRFRARCHLTQHLFAEHDVGEGHKQIKRNYYQCSVVGCKATFSTPEYLEKHRLEYHGENGDKPPAFQCQFCDKRFHQKAKLNVHETIHKNIVTKPFTCDICSNGFPSKDYLHYHWKYTHKLSVEELKTKRRELKLNSLLLDSATK